MVVGFTRIKELRAQWCKERNGAQSAEVAQVVAGLEIGRAIMQTATGTQVVNY